MYCLKVYATDILAIASNARVSLSVERTSVMSGSSRCPSKRHEASRVLSCYMSSAEYSGVVPLMLQTLNIDRLGLPQAVLRAQIEWDCCLAAAFTTCAVGGTERLISTTRPPQIHCALFISEDMESEDDDYQLQLALALSMAVRAHRQRSLTHQGQSSMVKPTDSRHEAVPTPIVKRLNWCHVGDVTCVDKAVAMLMNCPRNRDSYTHDCAVSLFFREMT